LFEHENPLDHQLIPAIGVLGVVILHGALLLFYRSHAGLSRNWLISLQIRTQRYHRIYQLTRHPMYSSFFL
jgi:protein-S-isoprenylcysteine O-methyltransferase Ste14